MNVLKPWVCLRVSIREEVLYLAYRLGEEELLQAPSADGLAAKVRGCLEGSLTASTDEGTGMRAGGLPPYRLRKVMDFVRKHLSRPITVSEMAEEVRMSAFYFARQFKLSTGETPMQFVGRCRIEEARRLLRSTDLKVEDVAHRVGYRSASHFTAAFHRLTGETPRAYREREGD